MERTPIKALHPCFQNAFGHSSPSGKEICCFAAWMSEKERLWFEHESHLGAYLRCSVLCSHVQLKSRPINRKGIGTGLRQEPTLQQ